MEQVMRASERIKCFCNCTTLTQDEIKIIYQLNIDGFVKHDLAKKLFRNHVELELKSKNSKALESLVCYELCAELLQTNLNNFIVKWKDLREICPNYRLEKKLKAIHKIIDNRKILLNNRIADDRNQSDHDSSSDDEDNNNKRQLHDVLNEIMVQCKHTIHDHNDYKTYRQRLRLKIHQ